MRHKRALLPLLLVFVSGAPVLSRAETPAGDRPNEIPTADQAFLDNAIPPLREVTDRAVAVSQSVSGAMTGLRDLLGERRKVLHDLQQQHPITDLTGIETGDQYDAQVMVSVRRVAAAGAASDTTHPAQETIEPIEGALDALPDLGKAPIAFMVLGYTELALATADSLIAKGASPSLVGHVVLDHVVTATDLAVRVGEDFFGNSASQSSRQDLVVARLRCPKDGSVYKLNAMKNQVHEEGDISTLYYLQCMKCGEARLIEFPQELASRLNRMAERQKQTKPAQPARSQSLEP
jgi:hypothetical protein